MIYFLIQSPAYVLAIPRRYVAICPGIASDIYFVANLQTISDTSSDVRCGKISYDTYSGIISTCLMYMLARDLANL